MARPLGIRLARRGGASSLIDQISGTIRAAIHEGRLAPGARLPSWRDLAAQLGVARGTVRAAYERLTDELLIVAAGPAGTHVAEQAEATAAHDEVPAALRVRAERFPVPARPFQMGVPAVDGFPGALWARTVSRIVRDEARAPICYEDPCGVRALRQQLVGYLALARGVHCAPEQIIITRCYRDGLNLAIRALRVEGAAAWMEEPGFELTRAALELAGMTAVPVAVDDQGLDVAAGVAAAPGAAIAVVTAGQQAPLGVTLSSARRHALLRWAARAGSWILEDDYLSELQLHGRAAPALMAMAPAGRVIYLGTFSKTLSPSIGVGFVVVPPALAPRFVEVAELLSPAPSPVIQRAIAELLRDGHYLRHLRRMKRLYSARCEALAAALARWADGVEIRGLAVVLRLPPGTDDHAIARQARLSGLAPGALSSWYATERREAGLLLGATNLTDDVLPDACAQLRAVVESARLATAPPPRDRRPARGPRAAPARRAGRRRARGSG